MVDVTANKKKILLSDDREEEEEELDDGDVQPMEIDSKIAAVTSGSNNDADNAVDDLFDISDPPDEPSPVSLPTSNVTMAPGITATASEPPAGDSKTLLNDLFSPAFQNNPFLSSCSDRFRSALARVRSSPTTDIEAWQALLTEVQISFRLIHAASDDDPDKFPKLDFIEACYGALLLHFPYSSLHLVQILEILYSISALPSEEGTSVASYDYQNIQLSPRQQRAEKKMEYIFQNSLGINDNAPNLDDSDESKTSNTKSETISSTCTKGMNITGVDLWLIYIKKRTRDATRKAYPSSNAMIPNPPIVNPEKYLRDAITDAYKTTLAIACSIPNCHLLWRRYLNHIRSWNITVTKFDPSDPTNPTTTTDPILANEQMLTLRKIYQTIVSTPMSNLEDYWREYEQFERGLSDVLAQVLLTEHLPGYQHARGVYMDRARYISAITSTATNQASNTAVGQRQRWAATPPKDENSEEMLAEAQVLANFRARCAYERTNPERKPGMNKDMVRQVYKEMICAFMRHPEAWHEWAMWELLTVEDSVANVVPTSNSTKDEDKENKIAKDEAQKTSNIKFCIEVFELARKHIPDCALLTISQAEVMEVHGKNSKGAMKIIQHFVSHIYPCSLGYVTLQKMVRRYDGITASRKVFSRARRYLSESAEDKKEPTEGQDEDEDAAVTDQKSSMVKSRNTFITNQNKNGLSSSLPSMTESNGGNIESLAHSDLKEKSVKRGVMTWHIYACHAMIEHRLNSLPLVAARIYELGLKKHQSFLATPAYVLQYADLLWELNETENLRALLNRAIAACDEAGSASNSGPFSSSCPTRSLWDAMLKLECTKGNSLDRVRRVEANRRKALYDNLDLDFTADLQTQTSDFAGLSAQDAQSHKTLIETLTRQDGYESAALIGNGLGRMLDRFELMGAFGEGAASNQFSLASAHSSISNPLNPMQDSAVVGGGGPSDYSFAKRVHHLHFQHHLVTTLSSSVGATTGGTSSATASTGITPNTLLDRSRAARERMQLQQQQNQQQQQSAVLAGMNSPEWLRPMISILPPPTRFHGAMPMKPPPHLVEMALAFLKSTPLPEKPKDDKAGLHANGNLVTNGHKRARVNYHSSDDEGENPSKSSAGYGNQFRMRQRARQIQSNQQNTSQGDGENTLNEQ